MISASEKQVFQLYPDYRPEARYEAARTLLRLRLKVGVLQHHHLSVFARFVLRAVALGVDSEPALADLLGVQERDLADPGAELLQAGLLDYGPARPDGRRRLLVTDRGRHQVQEAAALLIPRKKEIALHYDPLTRQILPLDRGVTRLDTVRGEGVFVIPYDAPPPGLNDLRLADVQEGARADSAGRDSFDVVVLLDLQPPYAEYQRGVEVFVLRHARTGELRLAAFQAGLHLPEVSAALQRLHTRGVAVMPDEAAPIGGSGPDVRALLPEELVDAAEVLLVGEQERHEIQLDLRRHEAQRSGTQDAAERAAMERRIEELQAALAAVEAKVSGADAAVIERSAGTVSFIATEEHRALLLQALSAAQQEVVIISPWMNPRTVDSEVCRQIRQAIRRGVRVRIGYGFEHERDAREANRKHAQAMSVIDRIEETLRGLRTDEIEIADVRGTHEKILICDRLFGVATSFNWLSYRGEVDAKYRRELGCVVRIPEKVEELAQRAAAAFRGAVVRFPRGRDTSLPEPVAAQQVAPPQPARRADVSAGPPRGGHAGASNCRRPAP